MFGLGLGIVRCKGRERQEWSPHIIKTRRAHGLPRADEAGMSGEREKETMRGRRHHLRGTPSPPWHAFTMARLHLHSTPSGVVFRFFVIDRVEGFVFLQLHRRAEGLHRSPLQGGREAGRQGDEQQQREMHSRTGVHFRQGREERLCQTSQQD